MVKKISICLLIFVLQKLSVMDRIKALIAVIFFTATLIFSESGINIDKDLNTRTLKGHDSFNQSADTLTKPQHNSQPEKQYPDYYIK